MNNTDRFTYEEPVVLEKIGRIAAKIAYYNFEWRLTTLVIFNSVNSVFALESFFNAYNKALVVTYGRFVLHQQTFFPQFVIFGHSSLEIINTIKWIDKSRYDNAGKFIIICVDLEYKNCDENRVFFTLAKVKIIKVVYLRVTKDSKYLSFSYDFILPDNCYNSKPELINFDTKCPNDDCFKMLFQNRLKNFYKCPLIVSTFEQPPFMYLNNETKQPTGSDGDIIRLVAEALNATMEIKIPSAGGTWGNYENNNWTGSLGDVFNDRVHVSVCSLPISEDKYGNFQISYIYNSMDIVWTAEIPPIKPSWTKLLSSLDITLRIAVFLMFIAIAFINTILKSNHWRKFVKVFTIKSFRSNLLINSWALFLGIPIVRMPNKRALKLIVFSWIWFSFIIKIAYQAALISSLKNKQFGDNFPDFESVIKTKRPYGGLPTLRQYYEEDPYVYDNWIVLDFDESYEILEQICDVSTNFVLAFNKEIIMEHLFKYNGTKRLQILPYKIVNSPTVMYFKKYSVFEAPVSTVLSRMVESGLTQFWRNRYLTYVNFFFRRIEDHEEEPFTFDNFKACLALLVFGWILSIIFFVLEVFCGRYEKRLK